MKQILVCQNCERDLSKFVELNSDVISDFPSTLINGEEGYQVLQGEAVLHLDPFKSRDQDPVVWRNTRDILHDRIRFDENYMGGYGYNKGPKTICHCANIVGSMYTNRFLFEFFYFEPDLKNTYWSEVDELDPTRIERLYKGNRRSKPKHG